MWIETDTRFAGVTESPFTRRQKYTREKRLDSGCLVPYTFTMYVLLMDCFIAD